MSKNYSMYWYQITEDTELFIKTVKEDFDYTVSTKDFDYSKWLVSFFQGVHKHYKLILGASNFISLVDASLVLSQSHFKDFDKSKWIADDPQKTLKIMAVEAYNTDLLKSIIEDMHEQVLQPLLPELTNKFQEVSKQYSKAQTDQLLATAVVGGNSQYVENDFGGLRQERDNLLTSIQNLNKAIELFDKKEEFVKQSQSLICK